MKNDEKPVSTLIIVLHDYYSAAINEKLHVQKFIASKFRVKMAELCY